MQSLGQIAASSIRQECTAKKLGNVHPQASFANMTYQTFLDAAQSIGDCIDLHFTTRTAWTTSDCAEPTDGPIVEPFDAPIGTLVLSCVQSMLNKTGVNTSLGTILLFAPILEAAFQANSQPGSATGAVSQGMIERVLLRMTRLDSQRVYQAIALCSPGGLGESEKMSVHGDAPENLLDAMQHASSVDDVALQYVNHFSQIFSLADRFEKLAVRANRHNGAGHGFDPVDELDAIGHLQLELLAERPDSLICRKAGRELASEVQSRAKRLAASEIALKQLSGEGQARSIGECSAGAGNGCRLLAERAEWLALDSWLRGHRSLTGSQLANPGTHADLIAAALLLHNLRSSD